MAQPGISLLDAALIEQILAEAFQLMQQPGIMVQSPAALELLAQGGASVDFERQVVSIPESLGRWALESAPKRFHLYNLHGDPVVQYGGDAVQFDPGSSGVHVLDADTLEHKPSTSADLLRIIKITEMLPEFEAQSTAVVCHDSPKEIGDIYRLYLVLRSSAKPVVTGAFTAAGLQPMLELLALFCGGRQAMVAKPRAVFDVCPTPPLIWSDFGAQNLIELARAGLPAQIISMPLAGAASPVTLLGSVVQHAAETISGIVIHQLAAPGAPVVWGGAPAIFDMRTGSTPMGAIETAMLDAAYSQVGKSLDLPTHTYLGASDAKIVDAQAGMESGMSALVGGLAGINMISGAGMLDFLACFSPEKLVIDAEAVGMVKRLLSGISRRTDTLAIELFAGIHFKGEFLKQKATRQLFTLEQHLPSPVIDRTSIRTWQQSGGRDAFARAKERAGTLQQAYQTPVIDAGVLKEAEQMLTRLASRSGAEPLPQMNW